jgi:phospholipid/cholesterol/gamma-HCH transport system substrate-binding protein
LAAIEEEGTAPSRALAPDTHPFARFAVLAGLIAAAALVALVMFGTGGGYTVTAVFENAGQLVEGDQVRVGGRAVGRITDIGLSQSSQAEVKLEVDDDVAPLHQGTTARIRSPSLSGIANRYVALTPGPGDAPELPDGDTLTTESTTDVVDLDQIFDTLDERTRGDLANVIQGFATQYEGKGDEAGQSARYFNPLLSSSRRLVEQLTADEGALTRFLVNSSRATTAIAERRDDLSALVGNANTTARAIGDENVALARALGLLPTTLRRANTTFVNLRATLDDLAVLVDVSKPATKDLAPFLRQLRPLVRDAEPTIRDLRLIVRRSGTDNDLVEATRDFPALQRAATPAFRDGRQALQRLQPVLEFGRPYTPDLVGWFRGFGQGASNYDANGHFARVQPMFNAFGFTENSSGGLLSPVPPSQRLDGIQTGVVRRCPGAATQPPADGSAPWRGDSGNLDCDPSLRLPGP